MTDPHLVYCIARQLAEADRLPGISVDDRGALVAEGRVIAASDSELAWAAIRYVTGQGGRMHITCERVLVRLEGRQEKSADGCDVLSILLAVLFASRGGAA